MYERQSASSTLSFSRRSVLRRVAISAVVLLALGGGQAMAGEDWHTRAERVLEGSGYVVADPQSASGSDEAASEQGAWDEILAGSGYEETSVQSASIADDGPSQASTSDDDSLAAADDERALYDDVLADSGYTPPSAEVAGGIDDGSDQWDPILAESGYA